MTPDERAEHIRRLVDTAPPIAPDVAARLAVLLRPARRAARS